MVPFLSYSVFFAPHHITLKWSFPSPVPPYAPLHVLFIIKVPSYFFSLKKNQTLYSMACFWPFSFGLYLFCYLPKFTNLSFVKDCQLSRQMSMPLVPASFCLAWEESWSEWNTVMLYGWCSFLCHLEKQIPGSEGPRAGRVTLHSATMIFGKESYTAVSEEITQAGLLPLVGCLPFYTLWSSWQEVGTPTPGMPAHLPTFLLRPSCTFARTWLINDPFDR